MKRSPIIFFVAFVNGAVTCAQQRPVVDRLVLHPKENIADHIRRTADTNNGQAPRFTITAHIQGVSLRDGVVESSTGTASDANMVSMDVVEAINPAITSDTYILHPDNSKITFGFSSNNLDTLLVSDTQTSKGRSQLTILAVNSQTKVMHGIVEVKGRKGMRIQQRSNGVVTATEEDEMDMPAWECGVGKDHLFQRGLEEDHHHGAHEHDNHHNDFDPTISLVENLSNSLRGTKVNPLNKRRLQNSTLPYNYQIDLFIEIDHDFIANTGGGTPDAAGITRNAYNYVNTLVTAANVIYESEIDTHLHVHTLRRSALYDDANGTSYALSIMRANYGGDAWHTQGVDLQHALLGKNMGGGIAYIGVLCNSRWGFGLTSGVSGNFVSLDSRVVWDLKGFMHEVGHNFASGHTHDDDFYTPAIDTCGTSCPSATTGNQWSTLMAYCQHCTGDFGNIMYTFGGSYDGSGPKNDIANWMDEPTLVANYDKEHESIDPHRESYTMYSHVSTRGDCVLPPNPVPVTLAVYDPTLKVPLCASAVESCSSGTLLDGRSTIGPAEGGNSPNTLGSCTDGGSGSYHGDESLDGITVSSTGGGVLTEGETAEIAISVYSSEASRNFADFYHATDPSRPSWTWIGTLSPVGGGAGSIKISYTLPTSGLQAVRVVFRYEGSASASSPFSCPSSGYDDIDDLVFAVSGVSS